MMGKKQRYRNWNEGISQAYSAGSRDACDGKPNNKTAYDFEEAYNSGYTHAKKDTRYRDKLLASTAKLMGAILLTLTLTSLAIAGEQYPYTGPDAINPVSYIARLETVPVQDQGRIPTELTRALYRYFQDLEEGSIPDDQYREIESLLDRIHELLAEK